MNNAYKQFFGETLPARTTVQVGLGTLRVEIDAIAVRARRGVATRKRPAAKTKQRKRS
jgi:hypothetical protein